MEKFPLQWPTGYKRSNNRKRSQFKQTNDGAQRALLNEIRMLGATDLIVSTNIPVRNDGGFYSKYADGKNMDPGVAIYFKYKNKPVSMCCDTYTTVWENVYALAKGIEALRGMDRWGVSEFLDRAFNLGVNEIQVSRSLQKVSPRYGRSTERRKIRRIARRIRGGQKIF